MSCIHPVTISNSSIVRLFKVGLLKTSSISVPCGRCLNCRIVKQSQLSFLCGREMLERYKCGQGNSFVTLTYDDAHLPVTDSGCVTLRKSDVQKFLKRIRRRLDYHYHIPSNAFRVLYCGEFGQKFSRPHYHICFFGLSTQIVREMSRKLWKFGVCDIGVLTSGGVRYVCKYMTKSMPNAKVKALRESLGVENPFIHHSFGLGREWILKNMQSIADNDFQFNVAGKRNFFPKYVMQFVSLHTGKDYRPVVAREMNRRLVDSFRGSTFDNLEDVDLEMSYLRYQNNVAVMRARGEPVDDELCRVRKYMKPKHRLDRRLYYSLASEALLRSAEVPF